MTPWPGICDQCTYLEPENNDPSELVDKEVDWFHWEPSYKCLLDCEWCNGQQHKIWRNEGHLLSYDHFKAMIESLYNKRLRLIKGNICGVGEPTLNSSLWQQIKMVKDHLGGDILLSTNGNATFTEDIINCGLDKIKIAIDSLSQKEYSQYRSRGKLSRVIKLTKEISEAKKRLGSDNPTIIWQYILFNYSDQDEKLIEYQKVARDLGVDCIRFVFTRCNNYSNKKVEDIPVVFPNIIFVPLNRYSLFSFPELIQSCRERDELVKNGNLLEASLAGIKIINRISHQILLGVKTYVDLLNVTKYPGKYLKKNKNITSNGSGYLKIMVENLYFLKNIYLEMGETEQSRAYQSYIKKAGFET
jgi:organic radical activating enzyme